MRRRAVFASVALTALFCLALAACTEGRAITAIGDEPHAVHLTVVPRYHLFGSSSQLAPINLAHLTVVRASSHDTIAGPYTVPLDPTDSVWHLPVDFNVPDDVTDNSIVVVVELLNLTNGVASIEWSGETAPIKVSPGVNVPPPALIDLVQGPADNLNVISVAISPVTTRTLEGDSLVLHAAVIGSGTPQVFWTPLDPTIATVGPNGVVHALLPGSARIVASAGIRSDTETVTVLQRPASVSVTPAPITLSSIGQVATVSGRVLDARGVAIAADSVLFTVGDATVAVQSTRGSFQAVAAGSTTVTAVAASTPTVRVSVPLNVVQVATTLALSDASIEFRTVGDSRRITGVARDAGGTIVPGAPLQFQSENSAVATVAGDGTVTARGAGSTGIVVTSQSATARVVVSVNQLVTAVSIAPTSTLIESIGATAALVATARDASGATVPSVSYTWSSSANSIATVDANGVVIARANGNATITATAPGGASATAAVTVQQKVAAITTTPPSLTLQSIGESARISADAQDATAHSVPPTSAALSWISSASSVATVDPTGLVTAVSNGSATITVRSANGTSASVPVTVRQQAQSVTLTSARDTLRSISDTVRVAARAADARGAPVNDATFTWSSSNTAAATVDAQGVVHAVASGSTTITATSGTATATKVIVVQFAVARIDVTPGGAQFTARGDTARFSAVARDASGNVIDGVHFTWRSSNPAVFTVDENTGTVLANENGFADVIAVAPNNVSGRVPVSVSRVATLILVSPDTATLARNTSRQLTAQYANANGFPISSGPPISWRSENNAIATVSPTGLVTAVADSGIVRITAFGGNAAGFATVTAGRSATFISSGRVLIYHSDDVNAGNEVKSNLVASGVFTADQIDVLPMSPTVAPLTTLTQYSCVLAFTNFVPQPDGVSVGNRLKEYVDAGGRVLLMTYALNFSWQLGGGIVSHGYSPFVSTNVAMTSFPRSLDFSTASVSHPLMSGVTDFTYDGNSNYVNVTMDSGATLVARDNFGVPLIGVNAAGNVTGINLFPRQFAHSAGVNRAMANACAVPVTH